MFASTCLMTRQAPASQCLTHDSAPRSGARPAGACTQSFMRSAMRIATCCGCSRKGDCHRSPRSSGHAVCPAECQYLDPGSECWDSDCCRVALVRLWIPPSMPAAAVESGPSTVARYSAGRAMQSFRRTVRFATSSMAYVPGLYDYESRNESTSLEPTHPSTTTSAAAASTCPRCWPPR